VGHLTFGCKYGLHLNLVGTSVHLAIYVLYKCLVDTSDLLAGLHSPDLLLSCDRFTICFPAAEPYMEVVNPFILKNKERMVVFLDHLSVRGLGSVWTISRYSVHSVVFL
jgi:hypothetical protein